MKGDAAIVVGLAITGATFAGLLIWGNSKAKASKASGAQQVGLWPDLRVGSVVLVDAAAASLPPPFNATPTTPALVDFILTDRSLVGVQLGLRGVPPFFSGTIARNAIVRVLSQPPPGLVV